MRESREERERERDEKGCVALESFLASGLQKLPTFEGLKTNTECYIRSFKLMNKVNLWIYS